MGVIIIHFHVRGLLTKEQVTFDSRDLPLHGRVSVGAVKRVIQETKRYPTIFLYDASGIVEYTDDKEELLADSSVVVRMASSSGRLPPLTGHTHAAVRPVALAPVDEMDEMDADALAALQQAMDNDNSRVTSASHADARAHALSSAPVAVPLPFGGRGLSSRGRGCRQWGPSSSSTRVPPRVCNLCAGGGHFPGDCPSIYDDRLKVRRVRPARGVPVDSLKRNPDGALVLPDGKVCSFEALPGAFEAATRAYRPLTPPPPAARRPDALLRIDALIASGALYVLPRVPQAFQGVKLSREAFMRLLG